MRSAAGSAHARGLRSRAGAAAGAAGAGRAASAGRPSAAARASAGVSSATARRRAAAPATGSDAATGSSRSCRRGRRFPGCRLIRRRPPIHCCRRRFRRCRPSRRHRRFRPFRSRRPPESPPRPPIAAPPVPVAPAAPLEPPVPAADEPPVFPLELPPVPVPPVPAVPPVPGSEAPQPAATRRPATSIDDRCAVLMNGLLVLMGNANRPRSDLPPCHWSKKRWRERRRSKRVALEHGPRDVRIPRLLLTTLLGAESHLDGALATRIARATVRVRR